MFLSLAPPPLPSFWVGQQQPQQRAQLPLFQYSHPEVSASQLIQQLIYIVLPLYYCTSLDFLFEQTVVDSSLTTDFWPCRVGPVAPDPPGLKQLISVLLSQLTHKLISLGCQKPKFQPFERWHLIPKGQSNSGG
jgi:hypothetical protein